MKLPFMLKFPWGDNTYFIGKLWNMRTPDEINYLKIMYEKQANNYNIPFPSNYLTPKLHTIRPVSNRFKVGQFVQPFTWTYKPYKKNPDPNIPAQFDFMPPLRIVSKQKFEIKSDYHVYIDGVCQGMKALEKLAINDGFKDIGQFFRYFDKPVENMEIRHFTELKY